MESARVGFSLPKPQSAQADMLMAPDQARLGGQEPFVFGPRPSRVMVTREFVPTVIAQTWFQPEQMPAAVPIATEAADTVQQVHGHLVGTPSGEPAEESKAAVNRGSGDRPCEQSHGA